MNWSAVALVVVGLVAAIAVVVLLAWMRDRGVSYPWEDEDADR